MLSKIPFTASLSFLVESSAVPHYYRGPHRTDNMLSWVQTKHNKHKNGTPFQALFMQSLSTKLSHLFKPQILILSTILTIHIITYSMLVIFCQSRKNVFINASKSVYSFPNTQLSERRTATLSRTQSQHLLHMLFSHTARDTIRMCQSSSKIPWVLSIEWILGNFERRFKKRLL